MIKRMFFNKATEIISLLNDFSQSDIATEISNKSLVINKSKDFECFFMDAKSKKLDDYNEDALDQIISRLKNKLPNQDNVVLYDAFLYLKVLDLALDVKNNFLDALSQSNNGMVGNNGTTKLFLTFNVYSLFHFASGNVFALLKNFYQFTPSVHINNAGPVVINNFYLTNSSLGECTNVSQTPTLDIVALPYMMNAKNLESRKVQGDKMRKIHFNEPIPEDVEIIDSYYVSRLNNIIRFNKKNNRHLIVFGPEIDGNKYLDEKIKNLIEQNGEVVSVICPSYHQEESNLFYNASKIVVRDKICMLEPKITKYYKHSPILTGGYDEDISNKGVFINVFNVEGIGKITIVICKDYLTDIYDEVFKQIEPEVILVQSFTDSTLKFQEKMTDYCDNRSFTTIMLNSCNSKFGDPLETVVYDYVRKEDGKRTVDPIVLTNDACIAKCNKNKLCYHIFTISSEPNALNKSSNTHGSADLIRSCLDLAHKKVD